MIYYEDRWATLHLGRAEDVLPTLPKESVGVVVTDPPYGVSWESGVRAKTFGPIVGDGAGDREAIKDALRECVRIVDQGRHLYVFGPADVLEGLKVSAVTELVWDKGTMGAGNLASPWGPSHERINFTVSKFRHAGQAGSSVLPVRLRKGSVLRFPRPTGRKVRHPSEKPVNLLRELIESSSRLGDTVLDPYAGIGSTGVAATLSGRPSILVEIEERYAEIAAERLVIAASAAESGAVA